MNLIQRLARHGYARPIFFSMVFVGLVWVIYQQADYRALWPDVVGRFSKIGVGVPLTYLVLLIVLSIFNWTCEIKKWQVLQKDLSFIQSTRVVLNGLVLGLITPFYIGDYLGRAYANIGVHWKRSAFQTFLASISQNAWNVIVGLLFLSIASTQIKGLVSPYWTAFALLSALIFLIVYFKIEEIIPSLFKKWGDFTTYEYLPKIKLLIWSGLRYGIYILQYMIAMWLFSSQLGFGPLMSGVILVYLIQSGIPLPPAISAMARIEIAILIFSYDGENELIVLLAALLLWIINIMIPAIIGYGFLLSVKRKQ